MPRSRSGLALRVALVVTAASLLAGCDKCADYFIANPFTVKPPASCGAPVQQPSH